MRPLDKAGSFEKSVKQDAFAGLAKQSMSSPSHCTRHFLCLERTLPYPYSLPHSITVQLRCHLLQEDLWPQALIRFCCSSSA